MAGVRYPLAVLMAKCDHEDTAIKAIRTYPSAATIIEVFSDIHPELNIKNYAVQAMGSSSTGGNERDDFELEWSLTIGELVNSFHLKNLRFVYKIRTDDEETQISTPPQVDAFQMMIGGQGRT